MKIFPLRRNLLSQKLISSEGSRVSKTAWGTQTTLIDVQKISLFQSILGYLRLSMAILDYISLYRVTPIKYQGPSTSSTEELIAI